MPIREGTLRMTHTQRKVSSLAGISEQSQGGNVATKVVCDECDGLARWRIAISISEGNTIYTVLTSDSCKDIVHRSLLVEQVLHYTDHDMWALAEVEAVVRERKLRNPSFHAVTITQYEG